MKPKENPKKKKVYAALSLINNKVFLIAVGDHKWDVPKINAEENLTVLDNFKLLSHVLRDEISIDTDMRTPFLVSRTKDGEETEFYLTSVAVEHPVSFGDEVPLEQLDRYLIPEATKKAIQKLSALCPRSAL